MEEEKLSISKRMDQLEKHMGIEKEKKTKIKKFFKMPFHIRLREKRIAKKSKLLVFHAMTNRAILPKVGDVRDGILYVDGKPHDASPHYIYLWRGKTPCVILPEWSITPIGTKDYEQAIIDKRISNPQNIIIRALEAAEVGLGKTKLSGKTLILLGFAGIVVIYLVASAFTGG